MTHDWTRLSRKEWTMWRKAVAKRACPNCGKRGLKLNMADPYILLAFCECGSVAEIKPKAAA